MALVKAGARRTGFLKAILVPYCRAAWRRAWLASSEGLVMHAKDMPALRMVDLKRFWGRARGALPEDSTQGQAET